MTLAKTRVKVLLILCCAATMAWAYSANAEEQNLVRNGKFEQVTNGTADGWKFSPGAEDDTVAFAAEGEKGRVANVKVIDGRGITTLSQRIKLEPHQRYRLSVRAKLDSGKLSLAIGAMGLNRRLIGTLEKSPMVPWFWDEAWLGTIAFAPQQWRSVSIEFDSGEVTSVLLSLGGYYSSKGIFSYDDVSIIKISA